MPSTSGGAPEASSAASRMPARASAASVMPMDRSWASAARSALLRGTPSVRGGWAARADIRHLILTGGVGAGVGVAGDAGAGPSEARLGSATRRRRR